jgi:transcriptional regulator with XRE-family HTH domain
MTKQLRTARHRALKTVLAAVRQDAGLAQRDLAKLLQRAHSFVGKIESGEHQLNVLEFCEYADALGASAPDLLRRILAGR